MSLHNANHIATSENYIHTKICGTIEDTYYEQQLFTQRDFETSIEDHVIFILHNVSTEPTHEQIKLDNCI